MTSDEAIDVFARVGLLPAILEVAALLDSHGQEKYGDQGWRVRPSSELREKANRHLSNFGTTDEDSGREHSAHASVRCLQLTARSLEVRRG